MKHQFIKYIALAAFTLTVISIHAERNRLVMTLNDGTVKVYDTAKLSKMTFDSIAPLSANMSVDRAAGFSLDIKVEKPAECSSYSLAIAPKDGKIDDWYSYIKNNPSAKYTESGIVKFGSLKEKTNYVIALLINDKYDIPCSINFLEASTVEADVSEKPKVGYLLFDDGTWAQRNQAGKTPIGVIFSTTPSRADQELGFTHGYALSLKDAAAKVKWSISDGSFQTGSYTSSVEYGFINDKDGFSHSNHLLAQGSGLYPAAEAAASYPVKTPQNSSGWYLPSSGQWYDICINLGGLNGEMPRLGTTEGYWNGLQDCTNSLQQINAYMSLAGAANYTPISVSSGDYLWFWTSSESGEEQAYVIFFDNDQLVVEIAGYFKKYDFASNRVRPVIAF